jgi:hypothetical protein
MAGTDNSIARHEALRRLGALFTSVADQLVLKLIANGLRTTFVSRMQNTGIRPEFSSREFQAIAIELQQALQVRSPTDVGNAMRQLNRLFRDSARKALEGVRTSEKRISA